MANNGRGFGNSNVMLVRNESSTDMSIVAMLSSCNPVALQVQRGGGSMDGAIANCGQKRPYYPMFEPSGDDPGDEDAGDDCTQQVEKKRRLTFEQVRSLERNFEIENKLEPERKMQLAKDLGLQPRQVAVWFQNRRARWKIKQMERDYETLTSDFNRLKGEYDAVLQEKEDLENQKAYLTEKMHKAQPEHTADLSDKSTKIAELASLLEYPLENCEGLVTIAMGSDLGVSQNVSKDVVTPRNEKLGAKATSSESIASDLINIDSPRTSMDSGVLLSLDNIGTYSNCNSAGMMDSNMMHMNDPLGDPLLALHGCHRMSVNPGDGSFEGDSYSYMLPHLEEERSVEPWWEWP
ncbi:hypothetical protein KC19_5G140800 [Ceratodon purpureus]|uniref:Homeobox domain-containing protein n=1 Tax=Ceratodon purpureus TaxID=3225 RepID=A0A8T0I2P6_CERPU|nr:hypothetical protein KC19_5G140800 [Ceratodon purpureus]